MNIDENTLRRIVTEVLASYLKEKKVLDAGNIKAVPKKRIYVYCEKEKEEPFLDFLRILKDIEKLEIQTVLENPGTTLLDTIKRENLATGLLDSAGSDEDIRLSFYPGMRRLSLCESGLGMDREFASKMLRKDFESGRKPIILTSGLDPFSGREPEAYRSMILNYIRSLLLMGVVFCKSGDEAKGLIRKYTLINSDGKSASSSVQQGGGKVEKAEKKPKLTVLRSTAQNFSNRRQGNLLTGSDMRKFAYGSTVYLPAHAVLTPMAKDAVQDLSLNLVYQEQ